MTTADITSKISALRAEIEKDSVSPENVGYLLQLVHDYTNSVKTLLTENLESLRKTIDNIEYDGLTSGGTIDGNLYVNGDARISDCLLVDGVANFGSSVIVNDGFWAHGGAYIYDGLEVFGPASFLNSITAEKIIANGPLVCVSDVDITGNATIGGTLDVTGAIRSTSKIIANSIDINEVFEADTLSATINSIDVFEVNSGTVLLNSNVDITGNATIGGTLDVTGGVTADGLTIGEVLISYDNRILGPELNSNVLIVNGKTVFTDEIEVSEHVTIDRQGYITGVMYTGEVDCTGYTQQEGVFVVQSSEPMELDTNVNIYQGLNVTNNATVGGNLSVTGSAIFNSGFWSIGRSSFEYPIYMNCEMSESHTGIYMQELQEWEHIRVIGFSGDAAGNEYIDIGEEQHANSSKYYAGIRLQGPTQIKGKLEARNHVNLGPDLIKVDATIAKVTISGQAVRFNTSIDATGFGIAAKTLSLYGNIILNPWTDSDGVERNSALYAYSRDASREHLIGLGGDPAQMLYIEIGTECDSAERIFLNLPTVVSGTLSASSIDANYALSIGGGDILSLDEETFYLEVSNATIDASVDFMGGASFADTIFTNKGINTGGNIHLGYHSNTALGVHASLTTEHADTGMLVHLIGLQDTTNGKSLLSIGSKSYASATAPDAIILITSHEVGSIELLGNVYVPQTFRLGGATFTYDATYDRVVCDKQIVNAGAGK